MEYQINPHFLYNSLDSINWMAQKAGNGDIEEIVNALAKHSPMDENSGDGCGITLDSGESGTAVFLRIPLLK